MNTDAALALPAATGTAKSLGLVDGETVIVSRRDAFHEATVRRVDYSVGFGFELVAADGEILVEVSGAERITIRRAA